MLFAAVLCSENLTIISENDLREPFPLQIYDKEKAQERKREIQVTDAAPTSPSYTFLLDCCAINSPETI